MCTPLICPYKSSANEKAFYYLDSMWRVNLLALMFFGGCIWCFIDSFFIIGGVLLFLASVIFFIFCRDIWLIFNQDEKKIYRYFSKFTLCGWQRDKKCLCTFDNYNCLELGTAISTDRDGGKGTVYFVKLKTKTGGYFNVGYSTSGGRYHEDKFIAKVNSWWIKYKKDNNINDDDDNNNDDDKQGEINKMGESSQIKEENERA